MATVRKPVAKKTVTKKVVVNPEITDEDMILGNVKEEELKTVVTYEDKSILYKVTNLKLNNGETIVEGDIVETFIGSKNDKARKALIDGAKEVITYDPQGREAYKIEVL